jgi:hypothetical protein
MKDPYSLLGDELIAAAARQETDGHGERGVRAWLAHRLHAAAIAAALVLVGGAVAVAATGVLTGSPVVEPEGPLSPSAGDGVPAVGGSRLLALRAADPEGGLPWGMRVVRTTRGQVCVQIGRVDGGQLGELGLDGAFHDDGRFHPLAADVLPKLGGNYDTTCTPTGAIFTAYDPGFDRSAASLPPEKLGVESPARDLRSISYGLLGPHAVSITYRTSMGLRTAPVGRGSGAYLIVRPVRAGAGVSRFGVTFVGSTTAQRVAFYPLASAMGVVSAATFRLGSVVCSEGRGAPVSRPCPRLRPPSRSVFPPTHSLAEAVHVTPLPESHASCAAAFLLDPCYRAEVEFTAPYAVTNAGAEYAVLTKSACGSARLSSWGIDRDVERGATVRTQSTGSFRFCGSPQELEVLYLNAGPQGPTDHPPHESVVVGTASLREAARAGAGG